ncbi:MAG: ribosomal-processing cysteine protease Prp [Spirochaetales bacterium]
MTKVKIVKRNNDIVEVIADGHTGYGASGEDIVCSALSSVVQTCALGLLGVAKVNAKIVRDDKLGYIKISLPRELSKEQRHDCNLILNTMLIGISDLHEGYSDFIELEVLNDVY